jgi:hypothetical protein
MTLRSCAVVAAVTIPLLVGVNGSAALDTDCSGVGPGPPAAPYGAPAGTEICPFGENSIEEMVSEFHRARATEREQRHLARERERRRRAEEPRARPQAAAAPRAKYVSSSEAGVPRIAPPAVKNAIEAANSIATTPYIWGGGHGSFESPGYDCSGAVSYALHGAELLGAPLTSGELESYGEPGPGRWITIYANAEHAYAVIAGLRWDTVGLGDGVGPRWHDEPPYPAEFAVRHPIGY